MKKLTAFIFAALMILSAASCAQKRSDIQPLTSGITFNCEITYYNECYEASADISDDGVMTCEITSPDTLKGLKLIFNGDDMTAEYRGLEYKNDISSLPQGTAFTNLYRILRAAAKSEVVFENDNYCINGKTEDISFRLILGATGLPISAEVPDSGFRISFKNTTIK